METYGLFLRLFGQNDEHVEDRGLKKKRKKDLTTHDHYMNELTFSMRNMFKECFLEK